MISEGEALGRILARVRTLPSRHLPITDAVDRFTARDLFAGFAIPAFDNSSMDGYAVGASSCSARARLSVVGEQPAGIDRELRVRAGEAVRIFTGAPMPAGADAVVMQEEVTLDGPQIVLTDSVEPGENVRRKGGDVAAGQKLLSAGDRIRLQMVPLLAAQGLASVEVGGELRTAIISTGDELARPGSSLRAGQIYESNTALVQVLAQKCGASISSTTHCTDRAAEIEAAVRAATASDVVIITGGVSVGARDFVKPALAAAGATLGAVVGTLVAAGGLTCGCLLGFWLARCVG
ncbi:MAG: molybdopterin molybdotransferase MoeA, partial [Chthoniobacterales bacterium]